MKIIFNFKYEDKTLKKLSILAAICLLLTGCGNKLPSDSQQLQIVCTIFPEYDWVREIVGDVPGVEVTLLIQNGTDLHSYQPSVRDIAQIAQADLFCYVGGASDTWVTDVLETASNQSVPVVSMVESADAAAEEIVQGMQGHEHHHDHEHEEEHDHDHDHDEDHEEEELDEHVWLSLRRAQLACRAICDGICQADPANAVQYRENCDAYVQKLAQLDETYTAFFAEDAVRHVILVADRFPFRYLAEDYDLTYYAAFPGCSAETEASFETIVFLAQQLRENQLPFILTTESGNPSLVRTIQESAGMECGTLQLESMQAITKDKLKSGVTYLMQMEENLATLRQAVS